MIVYDVITLLVQFGVLVGLLAQDLNEDKQNLNNTSYFFYWALTSGLVIIMLGFKVYYGARFMWYSTRKYNRSIHEINKRKNNQEQVRGTVSQRVNESEE